MGENPQAADTAGVNVARVLEALQLRLRAIGLQVPYQLLLSLPYLATIVALALARRNASYPAALLKPYKREE